MILIPNCWYNAVFHRKKSGCKKTSALHSRVLSKRRLSVISKNTLLYNESIVSSVSIRINVQLLSFRDKNMLF